MQTVDRIAITRTDRPEQLLRLFLVLIEMRTGGQLSGRHTNLLSRTPGVRPHQAERRFVAFNCRGVGTALSADWKRPLALDAQYTGAAYLDARGLTYSRMGI
jgi:hypothetical protein